MACRFAFVLKAAPGLIKSNPMSPISVFQLISRQGIPCCNTGLVYTEALPMTRLDFGARTLVRFIVLWLAWNELKFALRSALGSWPQCAVEKPWPLLMNLNRGARPGRAADSFEA